MEIGIRLAKSKAKSLDEARPKMKIRRQQNCEEQNSKDWTLYKTIKEHLTNRTCPKSLVKTTQTKVNQIIEKLHWGKHIDDMTKKWLSQTSSPPRFLFSTRLQKRRPIISGYDYPTEKISSFVDTLLQPIAQKQQSYTKGTTDFINFIEKKNKDRQRHNFSSNGCF